MQQKSPALRRAFLLLRTPPDNHLLGRHVPSRTARPHAQPL